MGVQQPSGHRTPRLFASAAEDCLTWSCGSHGSFHYSRTQGCSPSGPRVRGSSELAGTLRWASRSSLSIEQVGSGPLQSAMASPTVRLPLACRGTAAVLRRLGAMASPRAIIPAMVCTPSGPRHPARSGGFTSVNRIALPCEVFWWARHPPLRGICGYVLFGVDPLARRSIRQEPKNPQVWHNLTR